MENSIAAEQTLRLLEGLKRLKNLRREIGAENGAQSIIKGFLELNYEVCLDMVVKNYIFFSQQSNECHKYYMIYLF